MIMTIRGPDDVMLAYLILGEQLGATRSQNITESIGEKCNLCKQGPSSRIVLSNGSSKLVCFSCGCDWDGEEIYALKEFNKGARRVCAMSPRVESMMDEWSKVRWIIERRPRHYTRSRWDYCTFCLTAFLDHRVGTYENVAVFGKQQFPKKRSWIWSQARTRSAVRDARQVIQKRAIKSGLLGKPHGVRNERSSDWDSTSCSYS